MVYDFEWYMHHGGTRPTSSQIIVKLVNDILRPESVVDVGCGIGAWLAEFKRLGSERVLGIDGAYVDTNWLQIPADNFLAHDLNSPLSLSQTFDLALSLEVAEHLKPEVGPLFVKLLTDLAPVVLFSAAIPHQYGTAHTNERWQSYWAGIFKSHGYVPIDFIRRKVWNDPNVAYYYKQNILMYVKEDLLESNEQLRRLYEAHNDSMIDVVHPIFVEKIHVRRALILLKQSLLNSLRKNRTQPPKP